MIVLVRLQSQVLLEVTTLGSTCTSSFGNQPWNTWIVEKIFTLELLEFVKRTREEKTFLYKTGQRIWKLGWIAPSLAKFHSILTKFVSIREICNIQIMPRHVYVTVNLYGMNALQISRGNISSARLETNFLFKQLFILWIMLVRWKWNASKTLVRCVSVNCKWQSVTK